MSYTTTTFTRRFYKLKVKKGKRTIEPPPPTRNDSGVKRLPLPPLFESVRALPIPVVLNSKWLVDGRWAALAAVLVAALCAVVYILLPAGKSAPAARRSAEQAEIKLAPAITPGFNMRPMRLASSPNSLSGAVQAGPDSYAGSVRAAGAGTAFDKPERQPADAALSAEDVFANGRKLVLPREVVGACNVGGGGIKDLGACLAQNGARAEAE